MTRVVVWVLLLPLMLVVRPIVRLGALGRSIRTGVGDARFRRAMLREARQRARSYPRPSHRTYVPYRSSFSVPDYTAVNVATMSLATAAVAISVSS